MSDCAPATPLHKRRTTNVSTIRTAPLVSREATRRSNAAMPNPLDKPIKLPQPNCCTKRRADSAKSAPDQVFDSSKAIKVSVSYTAMGSFTPDSISKVAATRSLSTTPDRERKKNTAAASVEPTMAPSQNAGKQKYQQKREADPH